MCYKCSSENGTIFSPAFLFFFLILDIVLCNISTSVLAYVCIEECVKISFMYLKNHRSSSLLKLERRVLRKCPGHSKRAPSPYPGFPRAAANFELNSYYHSFCHEILHILAKFHCFWVINSIYILIFISGHINCYSVLKKKHFDEIFHMSILKMFLNNVMGRNFCFLHISGCRSRAKEQL